MTRINIENEKNIQTENLKENRERERGGGGRERLAYQSEGKLSDEQSMDTISPRRATVYTMHTTLPRSTQTLPRGPSV